MTAEAASVAVELLADAICDLLSERAQSIGVLDVQVAVNDTWIDCELLFDRAPDMGCAFDTRSGRVRYCELCGDDDERWLDASVVIEEPLGARSDDERRARALQLLTGVLDARRPLRS